MRRHIVCAGLAALAVLFFTTTKSLAEETVNPLPVNEIAPGIFVFQGAYQLFTPQNQGAICNVGFIVGKQAVAVIDTGGSVIEGERLKAAIRARTNLPIRYVINTHMHPDHIFGNAAFEGPETEFVGHAKLARALAARADYYISANTPLLGSESARGIKIIPPTINVSATLDLDLGGRTLRLTAHPTAHTDNDLSILDIKTRTLFAGDLLFAKHIPALDGSLVGWLQVIETLKKAEADRVVPGHGPVALPLAQAFDAQERYLRRLMADVTADIKAGKPLAQSVQTAGGSERNNWELFSDFNARNAAAAFAELEWQ